jgi:hypothetical protein
MKQQHEKKEIKKTKSAHVTKVLLYSSEGVNKSVLKHSLKNDTKFRMKLLNRTILLHSAL